jgi:hypothetical protein
VDEKGLSLNKIIVGKKEMIETEQWDQIIKGERKRNLNYLDDKYHNIELLCQQGHQDLYRWRRNI